MKQVEAQEMLVSQELDLLFVVWITYHQQLLQTTQPQATQQQLTPSQLECVPCCHWDNAQLKCVAS